MKRRIKKLRTTYKRFCEHPLTRKAPLFYFLTRYVRFHLFGLWKNGITYSWINGLVLNLKKGDSGLLANYYYGLAEFEESLCLYHFLREEDLFFDIGANLGHYSLLLSNGQRCKSIALEPVPETYERLCGLISQNKLLGIVVPLNLGVSDKADVLYFSLDKSTMNRVVDKTYSNSKQIPVLTLDDLSEQYGIPSAIKIDVEGFEFFVLNGGASVLVKPEIKMIVMELNNSGRHYGISDEDLFQKILGFGFVPIRYDYSQRNIELVSYFNKENFNTIFIREIEFVKARVKSAKSLKIKKSHY